FPPVQALHDATRACYTARRKGVRVVYGTALEKRRAERHRGFESHPFRQVRHIHRAGAVRGERATCLLAIAVSRPLALPEESHRGLVGATGNRVRLKGRRGFESHLLRRKRLRNLPSRGSPLLLWPLLSVPATVPPVSPPTHCHLLQCGRARPWRQPGRKHCLPRLTCGGTRAYPAVAPVLHGRKAMCARQLDDHCVPRTPRPAP